jgi:ribonucleoside-diphosphate reductase alpha chain
MIFVLPFSSLFSLSLFFASHHTKPNIWKGYSMLTVPKESSSSNNSSSSNVVGSAPVIAGQSEQHQVDFTSRYWESTQETLVGLYGKRDGNGQPIETVDEIIYRVAMSVAIAELKYALTTQELVDLTLESAIKHPAVTQWAQVFADNIGNQKFWANTPANINADPAVAVKVLQYWAHGKLAGMKEDEIWTRSEELRLAFINDRTSKLSEHEVVMGALSSTLRGTGCLAACGVAYVIDSLEGIQEAARIEALAAKAAMGMGLNTSSLRPWSSIISNGAAASGPDRFYEKTIAKAVEAVAQGGRRGGALIELRNSDHPDILFFIDKKKLIPPPSLSKIYRDNLKTNKQSAGEGAVAFKKRMLAMAEQKYGEQYAQYIDRQNYLKNTNITVLAMPGFMEAVEGKRFIPAVFDGKNWAGPVYDPRKPVLDEKTGGVKVNKLTKEATYEEYSVEIAKFPEALDAARRLPNAVVEITDNIIRVRGYFYAPEVFGRVIEGMKDSGEPGLAFYETVNAGNANNHAYDLNTCNPCGEQFLPAGPGKDGRTYMGNCNLSSVHAAHADFWNPDGSYNFAAMRAVARIQQRFMDNVTDVSWYPIPAQNMTARLERRNGGGFAGIAEFLSRLGVRFGDQEALDATQDLFRHYTKASFEASSDLAKERGVYPLWEGSRFHKKNQRVRNSCMTNNAPTGTLAQALQTSWGVDPHNGIVFSRKVRSRFVDFVAPGFKDLMEKAGAWPTNEADEAALMKAIRTNNKSVQGLAQVPESVQKAFPIRVEVSPEAYIKHLAAIHDGANEYPETFNSVSNTCSIPLDSSEQAVFESAMLAWKLGVKDITFYPDGSRLSQPVEKIASQDYSRETDLLTQLGHQERRNINAEETNGQTYKVRVGSPEGVSTLHVSLNHETARPGELIEVYARMGKPGALESGLFEAVGRLASAFLQYAAEFGEDERIKAEDTIVKQLVNIQSGYPAFFKFGDSDKAITIQSPCDGLAKAIQHYRRNFSKTASSEYNMLVKLEASVSGSNSLHSGEISVTASSSQHVEAGTASSANAGSEYLHRALPSCGKCGAEAFIKIDGCLVCQGCGFSKCG